MDQPILRNHELETLRQVHDEVFRAHTIDITWPVEDGPQAMRARLARLCDEAHDAVAAGVNILILSDRRLGPRRVAIPSLLAVAAVHNHLVREGTRLRTGLVLESGEPREVHHMATLIGYGCSAINPYLLFDTVGEMVIGGRVPAVEDVDVAERNIVKAIGKGLLKTISKMGISTVQSYCGAQIFEAVGLDRDIIDRHFTGTASRIGGIGVEVLAQETLDRHAQAYPGAHDRLLPVGGIYAWRRDGEHHMWNPETIALLQHAVRSQNGDAQEKYDEYSALVNDHASRRATLRGLMKFRTEGVEPVPLEEVEPAQEIVRRFATGAMSLGSISRESHETLAQAMNRLGGRSNTGEGGEDPVRFTDDRRSSIKQVASGRFGVTIHYLVNSDQLQIKMAQGAKPGEGGQLPGHKVDKYIGGVRHTTPGVGLDLPAAPPRHLLDRGPQAAHLRPALRQPARTGVGEARRRGGRRHRRRRRGQGQRRPRADRRPRRRHRRVAAVLHPGGRRAVGDRPGRDPADAAAQRPALAHHRADRRPAEDGSRRGDRRDARRRRDGLLHRPAHRHGLHHDARLSPEHVPGGHRHAGSRAAQALPGHPRARHQLLLLRGRGDAPRSWRRSACARWTS